MLCLSRRRITTTTSLIRNEFINVFTKRLIRFRRDEENSQGTSPELRGRATINRWRIRIYVTSGKGRPSNVERKYRQQINSRCGISLYQETRGGKHMQIKAIATCIGGKWLIEQGLNASHRHVYRIIESDRPFLSSLCYINEMTAGNDETRNGVAFDIFLRFSYAFDKFTLRLFASPTPRVSCAKEIERWRKELIFFCCQPIH